jgi:quercetin dioxygenase-like cupin family protein
VITLPFANVALMETNNSVASTVRRVVTGHDTEHRAKVIAKNGNMASRAGRSGSMTQLWSTSSTPATIAIGEDIPDPATESSSAIPPVSGSRFVIMDYPPGNIGTMHRTETLDYVVVLSGEIDMVMDDSTIKLRAGDTLVQRGTNHAWHNRGIENARLAVVLVSAEPLRIGEPRTA